MTSFPNAKINIGLNITGKRDDGYHNIESLFYPVGVCDALEFVVKKSGDKSDELTVTGIKTDIKDNLVIKALKILRKEYSIPHLRIHLHKAIPAGSGLGGGSSDAAFMLRYINRYFKIGIDSKKITDIAIQIGSDCPFFIRNKPAIITGRGEFITETDFSLAGKYLLLVYPGIHISTAEAYSLVIPRNAANSIIAGIKKPVRKWREYIQNDFQDTIIHRFPLIGEIIDNIYHEGALYCSMSGSGSAVYGIFDEFPGNNIYDSYWTWRGRL